MIEIDEPTNVVAEDIMVIGIDLGTTNSLVSYIKNDICFVLDQNSNYLHPSVVAINHNNHILVGNEVTNEKDKIYSVKRLLGKKIEDIDHQSNFYNIDYTSKNLRLLLKDKYFTPVDISSKILKYLKFLTESQIRKEISKAVITVPAYFSEISRNDTIKAANLAGIEVIRLINEPTAAAIAYNLHKKIKGNYLVYDLGGGTFDISCIRISKGVIKVIGVSGDNNLGGDDIDNIIYKEIINQFSFKNLSLQEKQEIKLSARKIKELINNEKGNKIDIFHRGKNYEFYLTKDQFISLITDLVNKTIFLIENLLSDIGIIFEEINGVILAGGSSRLKIIKEKLSTYFYKSKILDQLDPDKVIAIGAAFHAKNITSLSSDLLLDVVPLSLGIEVFGGMVERIIDRNSTIPISVTKEFTTYANYQSGIKISVLQGERKMAKDCVELANFEITNFPKKKAGEIKIDITFNIDADGILTISSCEKESNQKKEIKVNPNFELDKDSIKNIIIDAKTHEKEDIQKKTFAENKIKALKIIDTAKQMLKLKNYSTESKVLIEKSIKNIEQKISNNKLSSLEEVNKLENLLV